MYIKVLQKTTDETRDICKKIETCLEKYACFPVARPVLEIAQAVKGFTIGKLLFLATTVYLVFACAPHFSFCRT